MKKILLAFILCNIFAIPAVHADQLTDQAMIECQKANPKISPPASINNPAFAKCVEMAKKLIQPDQTVEKKVDLNVDDEEASCPCPYSYDEHGQLCGDRSAYIKNESMSPECYGAGIGVNPANPNAPATSTYIIKKN